MPASDLINPHAVAADQPTVDGLLEGKIIAVDAGRMTVESDALDGARHARVARGRLTGAAAGDAVWLLALPSGQLLAVAREPA